MAETDFLKNVKMEQFIKTNNTQVDGSISKMSDVVVANCSTLIKQQKTQTTKLSNLSTKLLNMNKSIDKLVSLQEKLLKDQKNINETTITRISKVLSKQTSSNNQSTQKKDYFSRIDQDSVQTNLLSDISNKLGVLSRPQKPKISGLGKLMMMGGILGYLLTGRENLLLTSLKGLGKIGDGLIGISKHALNLPKTLTSVMDTFKNIPKVVKSFIPTMKSIPKMISGGFKSITSIPKMIGSVAKGGFKAFSKTGLKKIPVFGTIMSIVSAVTKFKQGDIVGGLLEVASGCAALVPGIGTAVGLAIDLHSFKRDLEISDQELQDQKEMFTNPVGSVKSLISGNKNKKWLKESKSHDDSYNRGVARLKELELDERQNYNKWQIDTYGSTLDISNNNDKAKYEERVELYRKYLGKGGGGFNVDDNMLHDIATKHTFRPMTDINEYYSKIKDNHVRLTTHMKPSIDGINPQFMRSFYSMAEQFNRDTGGYISINSGKRNDNGVHGKGYAIDANAFNADGTRFGDGYIPEQYLSAFGLHRPLLNWKSMYGGTKDEPWHIEPYPGEKEYGGKRNTLVSGQPYRKGILLAGKNGYAHSNTGGDTNMNLPQGVVGNKTKTNEPILVKLSSQDIDSISIALGKQIKNIKPAENIMVSSNMSNPRSNL